MADAVDTKERSVLDDIRSTIASLDVLRGSYAENTNGRDKASSPTVTADVANPQAPDNTLSSDNQHSHNSERQAADQASATLTALDPQPETTDDNTVEVNTVDDASNASVDDNTADSVATLAPADISTAVIQDVSAEVSDDADISPAQVVSPDLVDEGFSAENLDEFDELNSELGNDIVLTRSANKTAKIMIVDDEPLNIMTFRQHLKLEGYSNFITTNQATDALNLVRTEKPDVVLLDIRMPGVNGLDILRVMGLDPQLQHVPVLILTASTDPRIRRKALDLGASDFLSKPVDPNELIPRVRNAIILKQHYDMAANEAARLEEQVERRTRQLEATRQQLILSLARAAEHRDNDTGNHVIRVGRYSVLIAEQLGYPKHQLTMLEQAAQLHDVGKIGIPDSILFRPGRLDPDQYELMKRHCSLGKQIIQPISEKDWDILKTHTRRGEMLLHVRTSPLLMLAARIAQTHHEKWDGTGYPLGLSGEDIPLEGRIVAVADVFDALSSERPYKKAFSREKSFAILEEGRGKQFDPQVLDAFFARAEDIVETQMLLMDDSARITGPEHVVDDEELNPSNANNLDTRM
jgi:putative two-component system response regulator